MTDLVRGLEKLISYPIDTKASVTDMGRKSHGYTSNELGKKPGSFLGLIPNIEKENLRGTPALALKTPITSQAFSTGNVSKFESLPQKCKKEDPTI